MRVCFLYASELKCNSGINPVSFLQQTASVLLINSPINFKSNKVHRIHHAVGGAQQLAYWIFNKSKISTSM